MIIKTNGNYADVKIYDTDELRLNGGPIEWDGKKIWLTEQADMDNRETDTGTVVAYYAHAVDADGNEYRVVWDVRADWDGRTNDDESEACDWDNPVKVEAA